MSYLPKVLLALSLALVPVTSASAKWERMGHKNANPSSERDEIYCIGKGFKRRLSLQVEGSGVEFTNVVVHLVNGRKIDWPVRRFIKDGSRTLPFDLPGNARLVNKVVFHYRALNLKGKKARVTLWGDD